MALQPLLLILMDVWGAQLEAGSFPTSYIPTTDATATRAADVARISGSNFGVSRTNLLLQSEDFSTTWAVTRCLAFGSGSIANAIEAPDGTLTADKLVEDTTASSTHFIFQSLPVTSGTTYTGTVYVKAAERFNVAVITGGTPFGGNGININLQTGATSNFGSPTAIYSTPLENGWYRVGWTLTASATGTGQIQIRTKDDLDNQSYTGDGTSGIYIWGAQLETGSTATAYIPTTTAAVTVVESPWYRQDEGTVFVDFNGTNITSGQFPRLLEFNDGTSNNSIRVQQYNAGANAVRASVVTAAVTQFAADNGSVAVGVRGKTAFGSALNDAALVTDGASPTTDATYLVPSGLTQLGIGGPPTAPTSLLNSTIRRLTYWPARLPNETLQTITQ
jgi:hypothetical protein